MITATTMKPADGMRLSAFVAPSYALTVTFWGRKWYWAAALGGWTSVETKARRWSSRMDAEAHLCFLRVKKYAEADKAISVDLFAQ